MNGYISRDSVIALVLTSGSQCDYLTKSLFLNFSSPSLILVFLYARVMYKTRNNSHKQGYRVVFNLMKLVKFIVRLSLLTFSDIVRC